MRNDVCLYVEGEDDDVMLVSGWGDVEGMREDLIKDWGEILERWDGKDKARPSRVVKLCKKVQTCLYTLYVAMCTVVT